MRGSNVVFLNRSKSMDENSYVPGVIFYFAFF
nr:MAG TPA: hypothetical protein [Caudoviricetes sp.]